MTPSPATPPRIPDYELLKAIGRGSYGEVWLARSVTGVFRIIKVVRRDNFEDERPYLRELEGISRFQAAASGRPRQLALLHVGRNDEAGYFYYVMEPADDAETGSEIDPERYTPLTLKELFARRGRLPAAECVQLALELARGLAVLHAASLIHRDIKPANIIFVQRVPKLADVGLVASSNTAMTYVGTEGFSPPEGPGTASADLYGLGKVLYEIATGLDRLEFPRLPPDIADSPDALLLREINALVLRTCDPDPARRPASAEAFARDLELIQAGQSAAFYEALRRRLRLVAATAGVIALLAAAGAGLSFWRSSILAAANLKTLLALYKSDLAVAQLAYGNGELGRARAALDRQVPEPNQTDLRHLEWHILANAVKGDGVELQPATTGSAVRSIVTDTSGEWLAAGFADDSAAIWNLHSGHVVRRLTNARVVAGFTSTGLLVVDEPSRALRFESPTNGPTGRIETGKRLYDLLPNENYVVVSPKGDMIVSLLRSDGTPTDNWVNISALSPGYGLSASAPTYNGKTYIAGLFKEQGAHRTRRLSVLNLQNHKEIWYQDVPGRIPWIVSSPDGAHFAANLGGLSPTIFQVPHKNPGIPLHAHTARVQAAAFSHDSKYLATADANHALNVWDANTGALLSRQAGMNRPATAVAWLRTGHQIVTGDDQGQLMEFAYPSKSPPDLAHGYYADIHGDIEFSNDSSLIAISATSNSIAILSTDDLSQTRVVTNVFQPIAFSRDSQDLFAFGSDWTLKHVRLADSQVVNTTSVIPSGFSVAAWSKSEDSSRVALLGSDGRFTVVDIRDNSHWTQAEPQGGRFWASAFTANGSELWTANTAGDIRIWRSSDGQHLEHHAHVTGEPVAMDLSPDGKWIAVAVANDSSIRIWDRSHRKWLPPLLSHRRFASTLLFTHDSQRLISGGSDGRAIVWRCFDFQEVAALEIPHTAQPTGDEGIAVLRFGHGGSSLAALTEDGRLKVWRTK